MEITPTIREFLLGDPFTSGRREYFLARYAELEAEAKHAGISPEELATRAADSKWLNDAVIERNDQLCTEFRSKYSDNDFRTGKVEDYSAANHNILYDYIESCDYGSLRHLHRLMTHDNVALLRIIFTHATNLGIPLERITSDNVEAYRLITYRLVQCFDNKQWVERHDTEIPGLDRSASNAFIRHALTDREFVEHVLKTAPSYIEDRNPLDSQELVVYLMETLEEATPLTRGHL